MSISKTDIENFSLENPSEPVPIFEELPENPFGVTDFNHPKSNEQKWHILSTAEKQYTVISSKPTSISMEKGTMGSGKTWFCEALAQKADNDGRGTMVITLKSNRGNAKLSRNKSSQIPRNTIVQSVDFVGDDINRPNGYARSMQMIKEANLPAGSLIQFNEAQFWGHTNQHNHQQNLVDLEALLNYIEASKYHANFDTLDYFFNGRPIPMTQIIEDKILNRGGNSNQLWACDTFGEGKGDTPMRLTWLQLNGGFLTLDDYHGSHYLRAMSINERRRIITNVFNGIQSGILPQFFLQQFQNGHPNPVHAIAVVSNPFDAPVLLGSDTRYGSTQFINTVRFSRIAGMGEQTTAYMTIANERE